MSAQQESTSKESTPLETPESGQPESGPPEPDDELKLGELPSRKLQHPHGSERNLYLKLTAGIQVLLGIGFVLFVVRGEWENVFLTALVVGLTLLPLLLDRQYGVIIPPEFQFIAVTFVYLSLYLGSAQNFYYRFWWWDIVLHTGSGFLLGIIGFVALFLLNRTNRLPREMTPAFICFFAVTFAVFLGVLWEIFEFAMDQLAPYFDMQSVETGVVDTMSDLIVDTLGAVIVAVMGWVYMKTGRYSFIADAVRGFVDRNPRLFRRPRLARRRRKRKNTPKDTDALS